MQPSIEGSFGTMQSYDETRIGLTLTKFTTANNMNEQLNDITMLKFFVNAAGYNIPCTSSSRS